MSHRHTKPIELYQKPVESDIHPRVLHVRIDGGGYNSDGIEKGLREHFKEYSGFRWQTVKFEETVLGMWERLIAKTYMEEPDFILLHIQNSGNLDRDVLAELNAKAFTCLYSFDVRDGIDWLKDLAPHLGLVVVPDYDTAAELKKEGDTNIFVSHSSADFDVYKPMLINHNGNYPEVVFIGNNYAATSLNFPQSKQRVEMVEFLQATYGDRFKVYGQGWEKDGRVVSASNEIAIYNLAKVAVTHNNFFRRGYTSDRIWRAMGCGTATVSQYYHGIGQDFNKSVISTWLDFDMLKLEIDKLLENDNQRQMMAAAGAEWVRSNHSWSERFQKILTFIKTHPDELGQSAKRTI